MTKRITAADLAAKGVCAPKVAQFVALFPMGSEVSLADCRKAANAGLNLDWFAWTFLRPPALAVYERAKAPAWTACERAEAPALAVYKQVQAPAWTEYERATASAVVKGRRVKVTEQATAAAWTIYLQATVPAWAIYLQATAPVLAKYERAKAPALAEAWELQEANDG